jgi:hypothetical protein
VTLLGELADYYSATWDPAALLWIDDIDIGLRTFQLDCAKQRNTFPIWNRQWFSRYYSLTRAAWVIDRLEEWDKAECDTTLHVRCGDLTVAAFLTIAKHDPQFVLRLEGEFHDNARLFYDAPTERYHGYGPWSSNRKSVFLQQAPYFAYALRHIGHTTLQRSTRDVAYPGSATSTVVDSLGGRAVAPHRFDNRGWSKSSQVVFVQVPRGKIFIASLRPLPAAPLPGGVWFVLDPPAEPLPVNTTAASVGARSGEYLRDQLFEQQFKSDDLPLKATVRASKEPGLHRIEVLTGLTPPFVAPYTHQHEVMVLLRCARGTARKYKAFRRQLFYVRALEPSGDVVLRFRSLNGKDDNQPTTAQPVFIRVEDESGMPIPLGPSKVTETNLFAYGSRKEVEVTLPLRAVGSRPPIYRIYTSSTHGPEMQLVRGADELLVALRKDDLVSLYPQFGRADEPEACAS